MMPDNVMPLYPGARPQDWAHLAIGLELEADLLPVVSNPSATISPDSSMRDLGKTPSRYNGNGLVVGIKDWTQHRSTEAEVERWSAQSDYGICIQTRLVRALDVDITDAAQAQAVRAVLQRHLPHLPERTRANSSKFLVPVVVAGDLPKRRIITAHGAVEFLGTGQQFIAVGTHPSGVRYEWDGGLPTTLPQITLQQLDALWDDLQAQFGVAPATQSTVSTRAATLASVYQSDPLARFLVDSGRALKSDRDGKIHIECPWSDEHSSESLTSTTYFPANTGGYANGHFECLHAHCSHRTDQQFRDAMGYVEHHPDVFAIADGPTPITDGDAPKRKRFTPISAEEFEDAPPPSWHIKGILPCAELIVLYGESGSGKSFMAFDLAAAVALGQDWQGHRVKQGRVVYVVAEGASDFRSRIKAYRQEHGVSVPIRYVPEAPNLLLTDHVIDLISGIGQADLVIIDTLAQTMPGGNENSGEDMGKALEHCKAIKRVTGATVMLVHHSGKDAAKGARGWSGLRAACDAELEVVRSNSERAMTVTKMKGGRDGAEFGFKLNNVVIGLDEDGEPIESCVLEYKAVPPNLDRRNRAVKGVLNQMVLSQLSEMNGAGVGVFFNDLVEACVRRLPEDASGRDRRREKVMRAVEQLLFARNFSQIGDRITFSELQ